MQPGRVANPVHIWAIRVSRFDAILDHTLNDLDGKIRKSAFREGIILKALLHDRTGQVTGHVDLKQGLQRDAARLCSGFHGLNNFRSGSIIDVINVYIDLIDFHTDQF